MIRADFWAVDPTKHFSVKKKRVFSEEGGGIQWMRGLVRISTGKAIQWRGPGHSVNRRTPEIEKLLIKSTSQKSAPKWPPPTWWPTTHWSMTQMRTPISLLQDDPLILAHLWLLPLQIYFCQNSFSEGGIRKKGTEKRPQSLVFEGFLRANPLCPPTPFRNFWNSPGGVQSWDLNLANVRLLDWRKSSELCDLTVFLPRANPANCS